MWLTPNPKSQPASITHTVILDDHGVAGMGDADWHKKVAPAVEATINQPTGVSSSVDDIADDA
jgi:hypothetical protein